MSFLDGRIPSAVTNVGPTSPSDCNCHSLYPATPTTDLRGGGGGLDMDLDLVADP